MSSRAIVRRNKGKAPMSARAWRTARAIVNAGRFVYRLQNRSNQMKGVVRAVEQAVQGARKRKASMSRGGFIKGRRINPRNRRYQQIVGRSTGTTYTTSRMIVRRTPREQRFLRKLFRNRPLKQKYVNRFGFAWMGAAAASKTIWYSVAHLKFNNIANYMKNRLMSPFQPIGTDLDAAMSRTNIGNGPDNFIYVGKCTFNYELYNPTNYIITCYIYDLICKRDTPYGITYSDALNDASSAPENCMQKGSESMFDAANNATWTVADPTDESGTYFNSLGMKPTDYHLFNTLWKVKGLKKIILPPGSSHHHVVIFNPKTKITNASLFYPHETWTANDKNGLAGLTQATLFGFQGQVAVEDGVSNDNTNTVGTLPGKMIVSVVKKVNIWNMDMAAETIISENKLQNEWIKPTIFTDLVETRAASTGGNVGN